MPQLDKKAASVFAGKVVRKDLVRKVKVGAKVPVFVLEYLLGKYCATDDPAAIDAGLRVVNSTIASKSRSQWTPGWKLSRLSARAYNQPVGATGAGTVVPVSAFAQRRSTMQGPERRSAPPRNR